MKKDQNKRLLGAMEFIDDKLIDRAAEKIKERPVGAPAEKPSKKKAFRQLALLAACLLLLGAAVPLAVRLVNYIPNMLNPGGIDETTESNILDTNETEPPEVDAGPEEYFTNGWLFYGGSGGSGAEYEGKWIHVTDILESGVETLAVYDPTAGTTKSICIDPNCRHSGTVCPVVMPIGWYIRYIEIIGDWCLYQIDGDGKHNTEVRMYNMKTGEARVISEDIENGNIITYPSVTFPMDGKAYINFRDVDTTAGTSRDYVSVYDPETATTEYLCDEPEDMSMIGMSNKRLFFSEKRNSLRDPSVVWSTDHSGGNLKKEEVLNFDLLIMSGIYAYEPIIEENYEKNGYNMRVYDITTDKMFAMDFGGPVKRYVPGADKFAYVLEGDGKIYFTDLRGENSELATEYEVADFLPFCIVGDYVIGSIPKTSSVMPGGDYALNIKTGELKAIPGIN